MLKKDGAKRTQHKSVTSAAQACLRLENGEGSASTHGNFLSAILYHDGQIQFANLSSFGYIETLIQAVKPVDIAAFLGRKLHGNYQRELGNRFNLRWLGRPIRHQMGPVAIKMDAKFNLVLRIETTFNQAAFFKQYRQVIHRDGSTSMDWAAMKKTIYSLSPLQETLLPANQRYLKFVSQIETPLRKSGLISGGFESEWGHVKIVGKLASDPAFAKIVAELFVDGKRNEALHPYIPRYYVERVNRYNSRNHQNRAFVNFVDGG